MMQPRLAADICAQPLPEYFPDTLRRACAGKHIRYTLPKSVRERLQVPEDLTVSEWAERYRWVTAIDAHPGRWRQDLVPHTRALMDLIALPWVREVWLCMVERAGKTQILLNAACRQIDRGIDSGNVFWLMPSEQEARKALGERIVPVFKASPRMARLLSRYADDTTRSLVRFRHGPRLIPAWANSPASLSSFFGRLCIGDEIDKCAGLTGNETDPITLLKKRGRDSDDSKYLFASTPAGKYIHKGTLACQQVMQYQSKCPHCEQYILMDAEHFVIPDEATVETLKHGQHPVTYACNACGTEWDEADRGAAYRAGRWNLTKGAEADRPVSIGALLPAWPLPNIPMTEIGAAIARAKAGELAAKRDLAHGYAAVDYEEETITPPELAGLIERVENYAPVVPLAAAVLTAGVDVQADRLEVEVVAWGVGGESWGMDYRQIWGDTSLPAVWEDLDQYLLQRWRHESGEELGLRRVFIDSGYRNHQVYRFCVPRLARHIFSIKGAVDYNAPEVSGPTNNKLGGVRVRQYRLGTQKLKTMLFGHFALTTPGPWYCHVPESYPPEWFEMLQAEHLRTRTVGGREISTWEKVASSARNESIDLRVYALAALLSLRIDLKGEVARLRQVSTRKAEQDVKRPAPKRNFVKNWR